ncbi:MAG: glutaredoxin family protein [bacterium]|nr:glutaredoxin family protein [bacterium]
MPAPSIIIYTRQGCCLCDEAADQFKKRGLAVKMIDIDQQPELLDKFNTCVPVVEINGKVRFRGKVNPILLDRVLLRAETP